MNCRDEAQALLYVDGELPLGEVRAFDAHLADCLACQKRVAALRAENELIGEVLRQAEPFAEVAPPFRARNLAGATLALAAATAGVHISLNAVAQLNSVLGRLSPVPEHGRISALFGFIFRLTQEDIPMAFTLIAALATTLLLGVTFAFLARHRRAAAIGLVLLLVAAAPAFATEIRKPTADQRDTVRVPAGEVVDDSLIAIGKEVVVEGTVNGDLMAFAERVRVVGEVRGSLITIGRHVSVDGSVGGDVYSASQDLDVHGGVLRSVNAIAADIDIASGARVGRDALLASEGVRVGGTVGRDLRAVGDVFAISGEITRAVDVSGHVLDLAATARIGDSLTAEVQRAESFTRAPGAQLAREPQIRETRTGQNSGFAHAAKRWRTPRFYFWQAVRIAAALALGFLLYWLLPALFDWVTPPEQSLLRKGVVGFLALVATPIAAVLISITVIGLPIGILALSTWIFALYLSGILVALATGQALLRPSRADAGSFILALLTGLVLVHIAVNLPYLGIVVHFFVLIVGLGLLVVQASRLGRRLRAPVVA